MVKRIGGILFLVGSIASIVMAFIFKNNTSQLWLAVCSVAAFVGALMTGSNGIWLWVVGAVLTFVGSKGFIANTTVSSVLKYGGMIVNLVAMFLIWKDSIKDAFAK